jgi:hypothetical protein
MANVLTVVWLVIAWVVMQTCIQVWTALMLPNPVERARQRLERKPVASLSLGVLFWGLTLLVGMALVKEGNPGGLQLFGWLVISPMLASSIIGGAAFAELVGSRIRPRMQSGSPMVALVGGALCTTLAGLLPVIGWVVFLPLIGFMSVGAGALGLFNKRRVAEQPERRPAQPEIIVSAVPMAPPVFPEQSAQQG